MQRKTETSVKFILNNQNDKIGAIFHYKNKNNCEFKCIVYGYDLEETTNIEKDINKLKKWLDQFFIFNIKKTESIKIPVFYGTEKSVELANDENISLLLSTKMNKCITKTLHYKTMLQAPLNKNTKIGSISFQTSTFLLPIQKYIIINKNILKSSRWMTVFDSIYYIIFAVPFDY